MCIRDRISTCYLLSNAHSELLFNDLNILQLSNLYKLRLGIFMFETLIFVTFNPVLCAYNVSSNINQHHHLTRYNSVLLFLGLDSKNSICYCACNLWNSFNTDLVSQKSLNKFKLNLKSSLLNDQ